MLFNSALVDDSWFAGFNLYSHVRGFRDDLPEEVPELISIVNTRSHSDRYRFITSVDQKRFNRLLLKNVGAAALVKDRSEFPASLAAIGKLGCFILEHGEYRLVT